MVLSAQPFAGAPYADLLCRIVRLHGPSTGKFEIEADGTSGSRSREGWARARAAQGPAGEIQLAENHVNELQPRQCGQRLTHRRQRQPARHNLGAAPRRGDRHEFGDGRFRLVHYRVRATTRFREYLPPSLYGQRDLVTRLGPVAQGTRIKLPAEDDPGAPVLTDSAGSTSRHS